MENNIVSCSISFYSETNSNFNDSLVPMSTNDIEILKKIGAKYCFSISKSFQFTGINDELLYKLLVFINIFGTWMSINREFQFAHVGKKRISNHFFI